MSKEIIGIIGHVGRGLTILNPKDMVCVIDNKQERGIVFTNPPTFKITTHPVVDNGYYKSGREKRRERRKKNKRDK